LFAAVICSQQPVFGFCIIFAWTGKTMVEIDADITPKSTSFSAGCIDPDYTACGVPRQCRAVYSRSGRHRQMN
jgi:hypothetical protein